MEIRFLAASALLAIATSAALSPQVSATETSPVVQASAREIVRVATGPQRSTDLYVYLPSDKAKAVIFVSHGGGSSVLAMEPIIARLLTEGFAVIAPLHGDSVSLPEGKRENLQAAFGSRIADLGATVAYTRQRFPNLPLGAFGYSYGSLTALIGAGALDYVAPAKVPELKAVVTYSSPGIIPGLVIPDQAFSKVDVPTMMVTGTEDRVPGFVVDPKDHQLPFANAPAGGRYLLMIRNADHEFITGKHAAFSKAWRLSVAFLKAKLLGDAEAIKLIDGAADDADMDIRKR